MCGHLYCTVPVHHTYCDRWGIPLWHTRNFFLLSDTVRPEMRAFDLVRSDDTR